MSKAVAVTVSVVIGILIIAYIIFMYQAFINGKWIFAPDYPTGPSDNIACKPLIEVTPITDRSNLNANLALAQAAPNQN